MSAISKYCFLLQKIHIKRSVANVQIKLFTLKLSLDIRVMIVIAYNSATIIDTAYVLPKEN